MAPGALVMGANLRGLGVVRSLGRRGIETWVLHERGDDQVARASRYARRTLPAPTGTESDQRDGLLAIARRHGLRRWTLFPTSDESVALLGHERDALASEFTFTSPVWQVFRHAYDKALTHRLADRAGVAYPWTRYPRTEGEVASLDCEFPVVLKPLSKPQENRFTRAKAWRVDERRSLLAAWLDAKSLVGADRVMVQELIPGGGQSQYSFAALCDHGIPLASLVARRTRQYPREFGYSSSLVETVDVPRIEERGRAILETLGWTGLVEVEFKHDARDGSYKLLDINGRVWTWHTLGASAGVDFPYLAWRLAQGLSVDRPVARSGMRWVRLMTDVPSAVGSVRDRELSLRGWAESLRSPRAGALYASDDPLPALVDPALLAWRSVRRASPRLHVREQRLPLRPTPATYD